MNLPSFPMRWMIPLALMFAATAASTAFYLAEVEQDVSGYAETIREYALNDLYRAASIVEHQLAKGEIDSVAVQLSALATEEHLTALMLVDADDRVLYASKMAWIGQSASIDPELFSLIRESRAMSHGHSRFSTDGDRMLFHMPVRFPGSAHEIQSRSYGALVASCDFVRARQQVYHDVERNVMVFWAAFMLVSLMIWGVSHFALTRRAGHIVAAAGRFAEGDLAARSGLSGPDELGRVGAAFDAMAERMQRSVYEQNKLVGALEHMVEAVMITDAEGVIEYVNPTFSEITGYSAEEVVGKTPGLLKSDEHDEAFYRAFWQRITAGEVWQGTIVDRRKDGERVLIRTSVVPIQNEAGEISNYVAVQEDVTAKSEMGERLRHAERMESVGTLVGGIAHEFNNMLAGMTGNLYLARKQAAPASDQDRLLQQAERIIGRSAEMIRQLLAFARRDPVATSRFDLVQAVHEALSLSQVVVPERIALSHDFGEQTMMIEADKSQIHQIVLNLLTNARDALEGVAEPGIEMTLSSYQADAAFVRRHGATEGCYAQLCVRDNGHGIAGGDLKRIFEPFFTTKEVGEGSGLGLAMIFGIMERLDGVIEVESQPGEGAAFRLYFPCLVCETGSSVVSEAEVLNPAGGGGELILLADDEPIVLDVTAEVLEANGYRVVRAVDGVAAVEAFEADADAFALAILDVVMPGMDGIQAARRIRTERPDLPVIMETGYDRRVLEADDFDFEGVIVLEKPVDPDRLLTEVQRMLELSA